MTYSQEMKFDIILVHSRESRTVKITMKSDTGILVAILDYYLYRERLFEQHLSGDWWFVVGSNIY